MKKNILLIIFVLSLSLILGGCAGSQDEKYTDEQFEEMTEKDLFELFTSHGLETPEGLTHLSDESMAEDLKANFNMLKEGHTFASYTGWFDWAEDVQEIYQKLLEK